MQLTSMYNARPGHSRKTQSPFNLKRVVKHSRRLTVLLRPQKEFNRVSAKDFPGGSDGKASAYNAGDLGSIPGSGRNPGEGNGHPLQYSRLENPMDGKSLVGYSPWRRKELDMTERLYFTH
ncbi:hypothetical protein MG293_000877 [Ovis ammon polii]|uniref:Uncharacterized protein n=1 Tax=Ovis ammon polii TaxID=230172 RepID=A0AAD4YIC2_OVIAM|nr:hypothetical protein MG293_000877 [Ovis ammon polii]